MAFIPSGPVLHVGTWAAYRSRPQGQGLPALGVLESQPCGIDQLSSRTGGLSACPVLLGHKRCSAKQQES